MIRRVAAAVLVLLLLPAVSVAAQPNPPTMRIGDVDVDAYPDVRVEVAVPASTDDADVLDRFAIQEDGQVREILGVRQASSADLQVALVIDTSGSMGAEAMGDARAAATAFLDQLPAAAQVAIISYATDVVVHTGFDAARADHAAAIAGLSADGNTALYDAVLTAIAEFPAPGPETKQTIVLLTDGADTVSEAVLDDVVDTIAVTEITLRGIAYRTEDADDASMLALADATDGSVAQADDPEALNSIYESLAAELTNRYLVDYRSQASGRVELSVALALDDGQVVAQRTVDLPSTAIPTEAAAPEAPSSAITLPDIDARPLLYGGLALCFLALALVLTILFAPRERRAQLWGTARLARGGNGREFAQRATLMAERSLDRRGYRTGLNAALERAGLDLRPGEFVVLTACAAFTAAVVGGLLSGWIAAVVLGLLAVVVARLAVSVKTSRRQAKFADQLGDTLQLLAGSLRAGYSFLQALDSVAREADAPTSEEFSRLVVENRLGRDAIEALHAMADRTASEDFQWVVQAIEIHREVGGDLAEVLDTVAGTIRERNQIRRQVKALSAEGRLSAWVLAVLPFGVGLAIYFTNRPYLAELTQGGLLGWGLLATGALLMTMGALWLRSIVRIEF